jgi:hypothetical protein
MTNPEDRWRTEKLQPPRSRASAAELEQTLRKY